MPRRTDGTAGLWAARHTPKGWITAMDVARIVGLKPEYASLSIVKRHGVGRPYRPKAIHRPGHLRPYRRWWYILTLEEALDFILTRKATHLDKALLASAFGRTRAQRAKRLRAALLPTSPSRTTSSTP